MVPLFGHVCWVYLKVLRASYYASRRNYKSNCFNEEPCNDGSILFTMLFSLHFVAPERPLPLILLKNSILKWVEKLEFYRRCDEEQAIRYFSYSFRIHI